MVAKKIAARYRTLADEYGEAKAEFDAAKEKLDLLKQQVVESGLEDLVGDSFNVHVTDVVQKRFVQAIAEKLLPPDKYKKCFRPINFPIVTVRSIGVE